MAPLRADGPNGMLHLRTAADRSSAKAPTPRENIAASGRHDVPRPPSSQVSQEGRATVTSGARLNTSQSLSTSMTLVLPA